MLLQDNMAGEHRVTLIELITASFILKLLLTVCVVTLCTCLYRLNLFLH